MAREATAGLDGRSRVDFMGAAKPGEYVADNKTKEGRAKNRGVIIELFRLREEIIDITDTRCLQPPQLV